MGDLGPWIERLGFGGVVLGILAWQGRRLVDGLLVQLANQTVAIERLIEKVDAGKCRAPEGRP